MNKIITLCLKLLFLTVFAFNYAFLFSQGINPEINTITVKGVTFRQVVNHLLSSGYAIAKLDNKSETVRTGFLKYPSSNGLLNLSISVRVQDSVAVITGRLCYNIKNNPDTAPDSSNFVRAEYTFGPYKAAFLQVDKFAKSLNSEIIYSKTD
jgi:hypothetical protein